MLTRLKVTGFKNLVDIDLRFGPFTCIAGSNAVGKSNIFDAIQFLSLLADKPLSEAALLLRTKDNNSSKIGGVARSIFHRVGDSYDNEMQFEVEMIIPRTGEDELGQEAKATYNFLRYTLKLEYLENNDFDNKGPIRIKKEELVHISKKTANEHLLFTHEYKWRNLVIQGKRNAAFISTGKNEDDELLINLHQDGGSGKPRPFLAKNLPRTVVSIVSYASETPTVLLAKREMQSWRLLQLEPSSLRSPDELDKFSSSSKLGSKGEGLPSTIYRLANYNTTKEYSPNQNVYTQLANRLSQLIQDVKEVTVDKDEKRQLLTLQLMGKDGTTLPARALSDGTLRFLALAVLDLDYSESGLICLEEPENGIYPDKIPAIIELLKSIPVNPKEEHGIDNPLRQVIINTHSPKVVHEVPDDSLVYIELRETVRDGKRFKIAALSALSDTWRTDKGGMRAITKGKLMAYFRPNDSSLNYAYLMKQEPKEKRVKDREDLKILQQSLF